GGGADAWKRRSLVTRAERRGPTIGPRAAANPRGEEPMAEAKPYDIPKQVVWDAVGLDWKSRMRRELHVRFREGLGVKFPRATRLAKPKRGGARDAINASSGPNRSVALRRWRTDLSSQRRLSVDTSGAVVSLVGLGSLASGAVAHPRREAPVTPSAWRVAPSRQRTRASCLALEASRRDTKQVEARDDHFDRGPPGGRGNVFRRRQAVFADTWHARVWGRSRPKPDVAPKHRQQPRLDAPSRRRAAASE